MTRLLYPTTAMLRAERRRRREGQPITVDGVQRYATVESISGGEAGAMAVPYGDLGPDIASLDPHSFDIGAFYYAPYTDVPAPSRGSIVIWMGYKYRASVVTFDNKGNFTIGIILKCLRQITTPVISPEEADGPHYHITI